MGTNYYVDVPPCENACAHCNQPRQLHVGKNMTIFRSYNESPFGQILSWSDWRNVIDGRHEVVDEYGTRIPAGEFIADVSAVPAPDRRRQYDYMVRHYEKVSDYLDADGFTMSWQEFC